MKILNELLPGCYVLQPNRFEDVRGCFVKTFHAGLFAEMGIHFEANEEFYSISHKNVVRGMHFQAPPYDHDKLVYCTRGAVLDVLLDLRAGPSYGKVATAVLSDGNQHMMFIQKGIAHGFVALTDDTLTLYKTSHVYAPQSDQGIRWDSFGFDWPVHDPIVSLRDQQHADFKDFVTPFKDAS